VAALGLAPVAAPLLEIAALPVDLPDPAGVRAVLVTSGNAIRALPASWHATKLLAVGDATARLAREAGFADVHSADGDAPTLADLAARRLPAPGPPLLLASGARQGAALMADLRRRGFEVIHREVYAATPAPALPAVIAEALRGEALRAVLFFSAETARAFVTLVGTAGLTLRVQDIEALAIGRPAGVALEALPWRAIRVAARPTQDEMLALLR
jgi:uroporphyrinogen-III synthase